jgi:hypothetical protein
MSEVRALIEQLVSAGLDPVDAAEIITRAAIAGAHTSPRSTGAIRQERYRRNKASQSVTRHEGDGNANPSPDKEIPPTPPKENNPNLVPPSPPKGGSSPAGFDLFWSQYPHKVGRPEAVKAFVKARNRVDLDTLMAGLCRYVSKTDDRPWCNPSTWLNQDRWADQPAPNQRGSPPPGKPRSVLDAINALNTRMEQADAISSEAIEGTGAPVFRLSAAQQR